MCATDTRGKRGTRRLRGASTHPCALKRGRREVHLDTICCQTIASRLPITNKKRQYKIGSSGDKRDETPNVSAKKIVKYRAICMALDVSSRNSSAAVPVVQSDPKSKRGNSHQRRRQGR